MIRVRLMHEGKMVKQVSSRVNESVVMERIQKFTGDYDEVVVVEGELSEGAKEILQKVAKKVVPAAMAAGIALGGASGAKAQNAFPGTDRSIGQHISDIFSPNYHEIQRQRKAERDTERQAWNARQAEIRKAKIKRAREEGRREGEGIAGRESKVQVYDQARTSKDGKTYLLYDMEDRVIRVPVAGTEFIPADSQRLAHYVTRSGRIFYVRHPAAEHQSEGINEDPTVGTIPAQGGTGGTSGSTIKPAGTRAPGGAPSSAAKPEEEEDEQAIDLDKDHGLDKASIDAIKKAGVAINIKEYKKGRLMHMLIEGFTERKMQAILDRYEDSWRAFKAGGEIDENPDFYDALFDYFLDSGEMPYTVAKGRSEDPIEWMTNKMDALAGNEKIGEAEDDMTASAADQAAADKHIIMQIRKAADYDRPSTLDLDDGNRVQIDAAMAAKVLKMFDQLRPDSKATMQQLLGQKRGFEELTAELAKVRESVKEAAAESYTSLNDAFPAGSTEIWYFNKDNARDFMMGYDFLKDQGIEVTPDTIPTTHVMIGKIAETNPEKIFSMMQGDSWSPRGEARDMITKSGTGHTSMSTGDIIKVGNKWLMVDSYGFKDISTGTNEGVDMSQAHLDPVKTAALITDRIMKEVFRK